MGSLWNRSGTIERYADDLVAAGAQAFFYQGGTVTPMSVYRDAGEASAFPNPVEADADGRWPDVFVPYTLAAGYDVQVKTAQGVQLTYSQNIPNPNPVDVTVVIPPEQTVQTGMIHGEFVNATKTGYVRLNGRTMGSAASAATERANADTANLFTYLWNNLTDAIAPVSGGRGGTAAADFAANKTIQLPDCRGMLLIGLDDMGNSAAGLFPGFTFGVGNATTPGSFTGSNAQSLTVANLAAHFHSGTTGAGGGHTHTVTTAVDGGQNSGGESATHVHSLAGLTTGTESADHTHTLNAGGAVPGVLNGNAGNSATTGATGRIGDVATTTITGGKSATHTHSFPGGTNSAANSVGHTHSVAGVTASGTAAQGVTPSTGGDHTHIFSTDIQGSSTPFNNLGFSRLVTWFIKL